MFGVAFGASYILPIMMFVFWCIASMIANNLSYAKSNKHLLYKKSFLIITCLIALAIGILWYASIGIMFLQNGWLFVEGTMKAILPTSLIGNLAVIVCTLPRLTWKKELKATNHPLMVVPIYAAMISTGIIIYLNLFSQPIKPNFYEIAQAPVYLLLFLMIPTLISIRKYRKALQDQIVVPPLGIRFLRFLRTVIVLGFLGLVLVIINVSIGANTSKLPESSNMMIIILLMKAAGHLPYMQIFPRIASDQEWWK